MTDTPRIAVQDWRIWNLYGNSYSPTNISAVFPGMDTEAIRAIRASLLATYAIVAQREAQRGPTTYFACAGCGNGTNYRLGARFFNGQHYCVPCGLPMWMADSDG